VALPILAALSPRFSSEAPLRVFIERHPETTFEQLRRWIDHPDEHVRRLVSEGTRPRLPWAPRLRGLIADPSPAVALLDRLHDDESEYVRRSVANHLNDISKDHPTLALAIAQRWAAAGSDRTARGDPARPALAGQAGRPGSAAAPRLRPRRRRHHHGADRHAR